MGAPKEIRGLVSAFAQNSVTAYGPTDCQQAGTILSFVAGAARWCIDNAYDLTFDSVFHPETIETYVASFAAEHPPLARTARSWLRRLGRELVPHLWPSRVPVHQRPSVGEAYLEAEVSEYLRLAQNQNTPARRIRLTGYVCLAAGAGLFKSELRVARGCDVMSDGEIVLAETHGTHARTVVVDAGFAEPLLLVAKEVGDDFFAGGGTSRKDAGSRAVRIIAGGQHLPPIDVGRLRATWLSRHLYAIGFDAVLAAAGIRQSKSVFDVVDRMDAPSMERIIDVFRRQQLEDDE